jgi:hypothetical protein
MKDGKKRGAWTTPVIIVVVLVLALVLYVLSLGPATLLQNNGYLSRGTVRFIYFPLDKVCDWSPAINRVITWYWSWWVD